MLKGIDTRQRIEFISKKDTSEPKTIIVLKPLLSLDKLSIVSETDQKKSILAYLKNSIVEVKNYHTQNVMETIESLSDDVLSELITEINKINNITAEETKN